MKQIATNQIIDRAVTGLKLADVYAGSNLYGTGADGAITYSSNTTITADVHATTITVNSGIVLTVGWNAAEGRPARIYATTWITINGTIRSNGSNGGNATSSVGGAGGASTTGGGGGGGGYTGGDSGGAGGTSSGDSRDGQAGLNTGATASGGSNVWIPPSGNIVDNLLDYGGVGGGGASNNSTNPGGGGGGAGGTIQIFSPQVVSGNGEPTPTGRIEALGGNGGTGGGGFRGGWGGDGGSIVLVSRTRLWHLPSVALDTRGGTTPSGGFGRPGRSGFIIVVSEMPWAGQNTAPNESYGFWVPIRLMPE